MLSVKQRIIIVIKIQTKDWYDLIIYLYVYDLVYNHEKEFVNSCIILTTNKDYDNDDFPFQPT